MKTLSSFIAALFLLTLPFSAQAGSIIEELKNEGVLVGYWDFRSGHCQDLSGNNNHGTPTDVQWTNLGVRFSKSTSVITVTDGGAATELQLTEGTLVVVGSWLTQDATEFVMSKYDAGGTNYRWYLTAAPTYRVHNGTATTNIALDVTGHHYMAVNLDSSNPCEGYLDGVSEGNFSGTIAFTTDDANLTIGNDYNNNYPFQGTMYAALIINRKLTATEHSQLYGELVNMRWPRKPTMTAKAGLGLGPELLTDGDMEAAGTGEWSVANNATSTKESGRAMAGDQVLRVVYNGTSNPYAYQNILTAGKTYRVTGWVRGDGSKAPVLQVGGNGNYGTSSTSWQKIDAIATASNVYVRLYVVTSAAGYCEFDNVSVREVWHPQIQWKSDWGVPVTVSNVTDGYIGNTPFRRSTGTWKIGTDTINGRTVKTIECVTAGIAYLPVSAMGISPSEAAYGTWDFWVSKADASDSYIGLIASVAAANDDANQDGYMIELNAVERVMLRKIASGSGSSLFLSDTGYYNDDEWNQYKMTRTTGGVFTTYMNGTEVVEASGNNPTAGDLTYTTSNYIVLDFDAGDKLAWSDLAGEHSFAKYKGVVTP